MECKDHGIEPHGMIATSIYILIILIGLSMKIHQMIIDIDSLEMGLSFTILQKLYVTGKT